MKRLLIILLAAIYFVYPRQLWSRARAQGYCTTGGQQVLVANGAAASTTGAGVATNWQQSFPSCTVTVYLPGTVTLSVIYSDLAGTAKANPFTAAADGSWFFYSDNTANDVKMSGGGFASPVTLGDVVSLPGGIRYADDYPGADAGAKIQAAHDSLPTAGGVIDASGFIGTQAVSADITLSKPVKLIFGAATFNFGTAGTSNGRRLLITSDGVEVAGIGRASKLVLMGTTTTGDFIRATGVAGLKVHDLNVSLNAGQVGENGIGITSSGGTLTTSSEVYGNYVSGFVANPAGSGGKGITAQIGASGLAIYGNYIEACDEGIEVFGSVATAARNWQVFGNTIFNTTNSQALTSYGYAIVITDASAGGAPDPTTVDFAGSVYGNSIDTAASGAFRMAFSARFAVFGNTGRNLSGRAFQIKNSQYVNIYGNVMGGSFADYVTFRRLATIANTAHVNIVYNTFIGNATGNAYREDTTQGLAAQNAVNLVIERNRIVGTVTGARYNLASTATQEIVDESYAGGYGTTIFGIPTTTVSGGSSTTPLAIPNASYYALQNSTGGIVHALGMSGTNVLTLDQGNSITGAVSFLLGGLNEWLGISTAGKITFTAQGTNQDIEAIPSGTGRFVLGNAVPYAVKSSTAVILRALLMDASNQIILDNANSATGPMLFQQGGVTQAQLDSSNRFAVTGHILLGTTVVGSLPAAAAGNAGQIIKVSDSTAIAAEGQTCVGGGAVTALAFSTGAVWKCF